MAVVPSTEKDETISASFLTNKKVSRQAKTGRGQTHSDKENFQPEKKHKKLSIRKRKECFSKPMSLEQLGAMLKGVVPANTVKSTRWAVNTFETWLDLRIRRSNDTYLLLI